MIAYTCDHCGATAHTLEGWLIISVNFLHINSTIAFPPGGRTLDSSVPDLLFHTAECCDAWCAQAHVERPIK